MQRLFLATILFLFPFNAQAGFPEGENGYDLKKLKSLLDYLVMKLEMMIVLQEHWVSVPVPGYLE